MASRVLGIDPGPERSAYAELQDGVLTPIHGWIPNEELRFALMNGLARGGHLAIETLYPRAEPVSRDAMFGQLWAGRFIEVAGVQFTCIDDDDSRFAATGNQRATPRDVRIGLQNIFGEDKQVACDCSGGRVVGKRFGTTKICPRCKGEKYVTVPGPLASFGEHERSALAAALWYHQRHDHRAAS